MRSRNRKAYDIFVAVVFILLVFQPASAETSERVNRPRLGGPDSVENLIASDRADKDVIFESNFFDPYLEWQAGIKEKHGLSFGSEYTAVNLNANVNLPGTDDHSTGGMFRLFGIWDLYGRGTANTGTLSFKLDHRHSFTNTAPASYSIDSLGYVDSMYSTFNDQGWRLTNLHWRQSWNNGKVVLLTGFLSAPDFLDVYSLGSPWLHYTSLAFSTGGGTISLPGDAALGAIVGGWLNDNFYILVGFEDANSLPEEPLEGFDTFFNENEYFKHIEIGWTTAKDRAYVDNLHFTLWQVDERVKAGVADGWGGMLSFSKYISEKWMPFIRAGYAKDGSSLLERSVSTGFAYQPNPIGSAAGNLLGFGANWGKPNEAVFGSGLGDQYAIETFYRLQVTNQFAITPSIQYLMNPALNPDEDSIWVLGLRARMAI